ncbi:MAG: hydrolase [Desulfobacterota bacterium]|jgi:nicotinamidase-related amidase|nr:hydrolase [Thermodesulfobacteriota bacterium]
MGKKHEAQSGLIEREDSVLVIIDMQEKLFPVMAGKEDLANQVIKLVRFAKIVGLPVIATEQEKLGPTLSEIKGEVPSVSPVSKVDFNCLGCEAFTKRVQELERRTLVLCGIEAHICVAQTALYAASDYRVHVVADAVASRAPENRRIALERMSRSGITITSTEMVIYEILRKAGTDTFREVLKLVK